MKARSYPSLPEILAEVSAVYRELEKRPFSRDCISRAQCCHFQLTGKTPQLTLGEALLALKAWRSTGRNDVPQTSDGACPFLDCTTARCSIYQARPLGCRTHFCSAAGGNLPRQSVLDLIHRLEDIAAKLGDYSPRPLAQACHQASRIWKNFRK
jgi:Fe-S-cluster containining protein